MDATDLCYLSAVELRDLYRKRQLSPVEVTAAILDRIERINPSLNAFVTVTADLARQQARDAEQAYLSYATPAPLAGIPVSIKDLTATKGIRTTRGSLLYKDWIPDFNAPATDRIYAAGAVLLGKTNTPEMGWKGDSGNRVVGPTHNPWKHGHTPGGSSGGAAAAVVAGLGPLAQGSDGAGSIRIPAGLSGSYGLKPSWALIPQYPASVIEQFSHFGPMSRTVRDAALFLNVLAGADVRDRTSLPVDTDYLAALEGDITGLRVAWSPDLGYAQVDPEVRDIAAAAAQRFADLGCHVEETHPDLPDPWDIIHPFWSSAFAGLYLDNLSEVRDQLDPGLLTVIEQGHEFSAPQLAQANMRRIDYYHGWRQFMENYDLMLTPTLPVTAFTAGADHPGQINGQATSYLGWTAFSYPFNTTGQPAATVPCGFASDGLPVGLQIVGRWRDDVTVLRASAAFEALAPWADKRPPVE
jgi:aspartyl-tRNA(Asn)/glutamyl-tRNA(Gln) amidotransferase subunit A